MPPIRSAGPKLIDTLSAQENYRRLQQRRYHPYPHPLVKDTGFIPEALDDLPLGVTETVLHDTIAFFENLSLGSAPVIANDSTAENTSPVIPSQTKVAEKESTDDSAAALVQTPETEGGAAAGCGYPAPQHRSGSGTAPAAYFEDERSDPRTIQVAETTSYTVPFPAGQSNVLRSRSPPAHGDVPSAKQLEGLKQREALSKAAAASAPMQG